jgi:DNA repair exonuclease SbcCD nuclease subunit
MRESDVAILQAADLHLGGFRHAYNYLGRTKACCDEFVSKVLSIKAKKIILVISGDFWDGRGIKETERTLGDALILALLQDPRIHVVMINGNHEYYDHSGLTMIHGFESLAKFDMTKNLHVVTNDPKTEIVTIDDLSYRFLCVPCQQHLTTKALRKILKALLKTSSGSCTRTYAVIHEALSNAISDNGTPIESKLDLSSFDDIDGYMLGDIHKRQSMGHNAWYCGSPWQTKYNEDSKAGFLRWRGSEVELVELKVPKLLETNDIAIAKKYADTKHSVRYTGLEPLGFEALNVSHVPQVKRSSENNNNNDVVLDVRDINRVRSITTKDMTDNLPTFLETKAKLSEKEVRIGIKKVKRELQFSFSESTENP